MIASFLCNSRRSNLISPSHHPTRKHLLLSFAYSLLLSAKTSTAFYPSNIIMASSTATAARRTSARLQKRSLANTTTTNNNDNDAPTSTSNEYSSMKVAELRDLLRQRGLAVSGVKSVLIQRLLAAQADTGEPSSSSSSNDSAQDMSISKPRVKRARAKKSSLESIQQLSASKKVGSGASSQTSTSNGVYCLPRTRELSLQSSHDDSETTLAVIGVDEAGRGPLAGPVVAAAAIVPTNIAGIVDSKKITKEEERERLYEELIASTNIRYAVAVISAQRIDEINILQATLEGMRMATEAVMNIDSGKEGDAKEKNNVASAERNDISYVITGGIGSSNKEVGRSNSKNSHYALIDGNKVPKEMPCPAESMVKGDGREYSIGAASILAKVTRDRLMHEYDKKFPEFNLSQHKGYPTAAHMAAVRKFGASPIHRRTFAPLKHMKFDDDGKTIG